MATEANSFGDMDLRYPIIVTLDEKINKYYPGSPLFKIPLFVTKGKNQKIKNTMSNTVNAKTNKVSKTTTKMYNSMRIKLPKEHTIYYSSKYIDKGTRFICIFLGGDVNKPCIIGRYDD